MEGQADKATRLLLDALKADPDNTRVRLLIGIAQCRNERYEDAIFVLEQLAEELPADAWVRTAQGTAFFGAGLADRAAGELRRALAIRPELAEAHFDLAQVLLAGDPPDLDAARRHYDRARELGLESDPATEHALQPAPEPPAPGGGQ